MAAGSAAVSYRTGTISAPRGVLVVLGRCFFALIFILSAPHHVTKQVVAYAAAQGVPLALIGVPLNGNHD